MARLFTISLRPHWNYLVVDLKGGFENLGYDNFVDSDSGSCADSENFPESSSGENPKFADIVVLAENYCSDNTLEVGYKSSIVGILRRL